MRLCRILLDRLTSRLILRGAVSVKLVLCRALGLPLALALRSECILLLLLLALLHHALHILLWRRRRSGLVCRCIRLLCLSLWIHLRLTL